VATLPWPSVRGGAGLTRAACWVACVVGLGSHALLAGLHAWWGWAHTRCLLGCMRGGAGLTRAACWVAFPRQGVKAAGTPGQPPVRAARVSFAGGDPPSSEPPRDERTGEWSCH
jgi:hypothetical protein